MCCLRKPKTQLATISLFWVLRGFWVWTRTVLSVSWVSVNGVLPSRGKCYLLPIRKRKYRKIKQLSRVKQLARIRANEWLPHLVLRTEPSLGTNLSPIMCVNGILNRNVAFRLQEEGAELLTYFTFNYSVFPSHTLRWRECLRQTKVV